MKPADRLRPLLAELAKHAPEAYQQLTMPGAGFAAIPAAALEDDHHEWWSTETAVALISECVIAIDAPKQVASNFQAWRTQYTETIDAPSQEVLDAMFSWHGGQDSSLYAAASCWLGGHPVTRATADRALSELERCKFLDNFTADDAEALAQLRAHLGDEEEV